VVDSIIILTLFLLKKIASAEKTLNPYDHISGTGLLRLRFTKKEERI
jgi:hypothetical protein